MLHMGEEKDCILTGINVIHLEIDRINKGCSLSMFAYPYRDFFLIAINIIIGQLLLMIITDKCGRRIPISTKYNSVLKMKRGKKTIASQNCCMSAICCSY